MRSPSDGPTVGLPPGYAELPSNTSIQGPRPRDSARAPVGRGRGTALTTGRRGAAVVAGAGRRVVGGRAAVVAGADVVVGAAVVVVVELEVDVEVVATTSATAASGRGALPARTTAAPQDATKR